MSGVFMAFHLGLFVKSYEVADHSLFVVENGL